MRLAVGSAGDAYDNAMCESFFATLECELLYRCPFTNGVQVGRAVQSPYLSTNTGEILK